MKQTAFIINGCERMTLMVLAVVVLLMGQASEGRDMAKLLVSSQPAHRWEEALLSGNGTMGAMVYGEPYDETIVINHCKLYLPLGSHEIVQDFAAFMPEFKAAGLKAGKDGPAVVHKMMQERATQKIVPTDPFHPAFILHLKMAGDSGNRREYERVQDLETGELTVSWADDAGSWRRRLFVSRADNWVVMEISGPKGQVGCELSMSIKQDDTIKPDIQVAEQWISAHTTYLKGKGGYDSLLRVMPQGGQLSTDGGRLTVTGADRILILMQVRPWKTPLPAEQSEAWAYSPANPDFKSGYIVNFLKTMKQDMQGVRETYGQLLAPHVKIHSELFERVSLDLYGGDQRSMTSESLLADSVSRQKVSGALMERIYDACRYLMICSTGTRPGNLQGIWSGTWKPSWSGDYTLDSNLQLEVQSLVSCNLPELMQAYFQLVESWLPDCRLNARKFYGCRGAVSNPRASNTCLLLHWNPWPGEQATSCLGWLAHFFFDTYLYTGDQAFLADRAVPILREVALFYEDLLAGTEDETGHYRFFISYSPEHRLCANAVIDIATAKAVLRDLIQAGEVLQLDSAEIRHWKAELEKMPPYLINDAGELQEWAWPGMDGLNNHRHHSHLLPAYQYNEFDPETTPDLWRASARAFEQRTAQWFHNEKDANSSHITHGMANQGQCAARLGYGDIVEEVLRRYVTRQYLYPSFMMSYWPGLKGFGIDPVGTLPDTVHNALIYSVNGKVDLLPALPPSWSRGKLKGILARGALKIDLLSWDIGAGRLDLIFHSGRSQELTFRMPESYQLQSAKWKAGGQPSQEVKHTGRKFLLSVPAGRRIELHLSYGKTNL